jgi:uncharacterized protein (TIGR02246 family)
MKNYLAITVLCAAVLTGCGPPQFSVPQNDRAADKAAVEKASATFHEALAANNLETVTAYVTDDVIMAPPGDNPVRGKQAMREWLAGFFQQFHTTTLKLEEKEVFLGEGFAVEYGTYEWGLAPNAGGEAMVDRGSYMQVWKRQPDGQWRFHREVFNSSIPPPAPTPANR